MGFDDAQIILENASNSFCAGQIIEGKVVFRQDKVKTFRGFYVKLKGACKVHWTTGSGKSRRNHNSHEVYINEMLYLMGGPDGEVELQPGEHIFPFVMQIPARCPPSYESKYGNIKYKLKFVIDRAFKFDQEKELPIRVFSRRDLNADPHCKNPFDMHFENDFGCCISFGSCNGLVHVPVTGYCPGQALLCEAKFNNNSSVVIDFVKFRIIERKIYRANNTGSTRERKTVYAKIKKGPISKNTARTWTFVMEIPPQIEVFNMASCSFIDIVYDFKVTISPSGCHAKESRCRRIVLGHIPLHNSEVDTTAQTQIAEKMAHHPIQTQPIQPYPTVVPPFPSPNPTYPSANPPYPSANSPYPSANPPFPSANPPYPNENPSYPNENPSYPNENPSYLGANPPYPNTNSPFPVANPPYPEAKMPASSAVENELEVYENVPLLPRPVPYVPVPTPMSPYGRASAPQSSTPDTEMETKSKSATEN